MKDSFKSLMDLASFKDKLDNQYDIDINEITNGGTGTGAEVVNTPENKLFYWKFKKDDVEDFVDIFLDIKSGNVNKGIKTNVCYRLQEKSKEMMSRGICPIECMLYTSKTINYYINSDKMFAEELADIVYRIILQDKYKCYDAIEHIIKHWNWIPQLKIAIIACGKLKDVELLKSIYFEHSNDVSLKVDCFKALLDSADMELIDYVLEMMSKVNEDEECDKEIANNLFRKNFKNIYSHEGVQKASGLLAYGNLTKYARNIIAKTIAESGLKLNEDGTSTTKSGDLSVLIQECQICGKNNSLPENTIECLQNPHSRRRAIIALRYTNKKEIGNYVLDVLNEGKCSVSETKEALITLGSLYCDDAKSTIYEYLKKDEFRIYSWGATLLMRDETYCEDLVRELYEENLCTAYETAKVIRQTVNRSSKIRGCLAQHFITVMETGTEEEKIKALNSIKEIINKVNVWDIQNEIFKIMGYKNNQFLATERLQMSIMDVLSKIINDNNSKHFEDFLFYILDSNKFTQTVKLRATGILKSLSIKRPTV